MNDRGSQSPNDPDRHLYAHETFVAMRNGMPRTPNRPPRNTPASSVYNTAPQTPTGSRRPSPNPATVNNNGGSSSSSNYASSGYHSANRGPLSDTHDTMILGSALANNRTPLNPAYQSNPGSRESIRNRDHSPNTLLRRAQENAAGQRSDSPRRGRTLSSSPYRDPSRSPGGTHRRRQSPGPPLSEGTERGRRDNSNRHGSSSTGNAHGSSSGH